MKINRQYRPRPIRFLELFRQNEWQIKMYSISSKNERVNDAEVHLAKKYLGEWLKRSKDYSLPTYKIATLILHECKEGVFAIINWWIDENMLQNFVYLKESNSNHFALYSENGVCTCVWEMAIWWHERNTWVKHILEKNDTPEWKRYLGDNLNIDI